MYQSIASSFGKASEGHNTEGHGLDDKAAAHSAPAGGEAKHTGDAMQHASHPLPRS